MSFFRYPLFADYSVIETTLIISSLGAVVTFYKTWKRTPDVRPGFWIFTFLAAAVSVLGIPFFSSFELFIVITLYCSLYIGRVMQGHLIDGVERTTDLVTHLVMLVLYIPSFVYKDYLFNVVVAYLAVSIAVLIFRTFSVLKIYWVWLNLRT